MTTTKTILTSFTITVLLSMPIFANPSAFAAMSMLPGGTSLEVTIDEPADGAMLGGSAAGTNVTVSGKASIGLELPEKDTSLIYVIDTSGSTAGLAGGDCGPDQNPMDTTNGGEDQIIDCEITAIKELNTQAQSSAILEAAVIGFAGNATIADVGPASGTQTFATPDADANSNAANDIGEVTMSIETAFAFGEDGQFNEFSVSAWDIELTDYADAINQAQAVSGSASGSDVIVAFLSDGAANGGDTVANALADNPGNVVFHTFAIGGAASCASDPSSLGSLQDIADLTGGTCTEVSDPTTLPEILPELVGSELTEIKMSIDGGAFVALDNSEITPDLPLPGPDMANYETVAENLAPGIHEICVMANGQDFGGEGSVTECIEIEIKEFEKFYTFTDNNFEERCQTFNATLGECIEFRPANINLDDDVFADNIPQDGDNAFLVEAVTKGNGDKINSYNPGQYMAVSTVKVFSDQGVTIEEDFSDCTLNTSISEVNPQKAPGGVQVALIEPDGDVFEISGDLAKGIGGSIDLDLENGKALIEVDEVEDGSTVYAIVKFAPGLKGESFVSEQMCTNVESLLDSNGAAIASTTADLKLVNES